MIHLLLLLLFSGGGVSLNQSVSEQKDEIMSA